MIIVVVSNYLIVGSGLSAFTCFLKKANTKVLATIFDNKKTKIEKSYKFYECNKLGGNTNIWGGIIDINKLNKLKKKNKKFSSFIENNFFFKISKISSSSKFKHVGLINEKNTNRIFRIKKNFYDSKLIDFNLIKIIIKKKFLILKSEKKSIYAKKINLCVGNLGLLKILYNSKILNNDDIITFNDGNIKYGLNFNLKRENYYVPMSPLQVIRTLIFGKTITTYKYDEKKFLDNLIVQIYGNNIKTYRYKVSDILNNRRASNLRFFISNHLTNLAINHMPVDKFIKKKTKKIIINCSGAMKKYIIGPVSQNIIYNSFINC